MANKDQKRSKETRKPKQAKSAPAAAQSPFIVTQGKDASGKKK